MTESQALEILRERSHSIMNVSAQGSITLTRPNGEGIRLESALVLQLPDRARLRAWKFGQAVFDMTLTPEGLWLIAGRDDERRKEILAAGSNTGRLTRQWLQLLAGSFDGEGVHLNGDAATLQFTRRNDDGTTLACEIQRKTLTPRSYVLKDAAGVDRFTLRLAKYAQINGIVWPQEIEAVSDTGRILINLRDVSINTDLEPNVFRPPARAEKVP